MWLKCNEGDRPFHAGTQHCPTLAFIKGTRYFLWQRRNISSRQEETAAAHILEMFVYESRVGGFNPSSGTLDKTEELLLILTLQRCSAPDMCPVTVTSCCFCYSWCLCCPSSHLLYFWFSGCTYCLLWWSAYIKGLFVFIQLIQYCGGAIFSIMGRWSDKPTARQQPAVQHTDTTLR